MCSARNRSVKDTSEAMDQSNHKPQSPPADRAAPSHPARRKRGQSRPPVCINGLVGQHLAHRAMSSTKWPGPPPRGYRQQADTPAQR